MPAATPEPGPVPPRSGSAPPVPWRSCAFGLELSGAFDAPGLPPCAGACDGPRVDVEVVAPEAIDAAWGGGPGRRLLEERFDGEADVARSIDHQPGVGYRLHARHFGLALVSDDGSRVRCAPPGREPWSWQRFLVGRILPWAAVLRGVEVLHASGVVVGGRAVAVLGPTGAGKTSLALHLVLGGAALLTDDVLAVDRTGDGLRAHPGAGVISVRSEERALVEPALWRRLGEELGVSGKTYVAVDRAPRAVPLGAMYFLERGAGAAGIERLERPDPVRLLASSFSQGIETPARLRNLLDTCADLAAEVPMFRLAVPPGLGAARVARALRAHVDGSG